MFPQFKKINNESGIVLFIVLMTAIIIMIFSVGILTQSMNEINYAQQQIDQINRDQLTKGAFWDAYASGMNAVPAQGQGSQSLAGQSNENATTKLLISNQTTVDGITTFQVAATDPLP